MSLLEVNRLKKSFGTHLAVDEVSFTVGNGEILGLLGPNGAGKSTTIMMLAGLIEPDSGNIVLDGHTLSHSDRKSRQQMGIVPQDLAIYPNLTARENLRFFGGLYGLTGSDLRSRITEVLSQTGLADRQNDLTCEYSGGMKRRLNFGVALLHRPRLLILDEPTVGVDPQSRAHLLDCVRQLASGGMSVIYCSHYMEEVVERLEEEKKGIADDIRDVYAEAKAVGYDSKIMRQIVRLRKMKPDDRAEMETILDLYKAALGLG